MKRASYALIAVLSMLTLGVATANAQVDQIEGAHPLAGTPAGTKFIHLDAGPYTVTPGANLILTQLGNVPKPTYDGYMLRMYPNLHYALPNGKCCGAIPRVDVVHLHHGVWLSDGKAGKGEGNGDIDGFYPFIASGEEKTVYGFPSGYGYPVSASDHWIFNYMIHNLTNVGKKVYVTYDMDYLPATAPAAQNIKTVHPIWMDVEDHHIYPVFDVKKGSGKNGKYTFPDMAKHPYGAGAPLNQFTVDHPGTLVATAGHVHPGGLYTDLDLIRPGATPSNGAIAGGEPNSTRLFQSNAHYWDPRGPISWDMAMTATPADWRPQVQPGDTLRVSATYETKHASWYESMGIMVTWEAWNDQGTDPFNHKLDETGKVTHGHLNENNNHGGAATDGYVNPSTLKGCRKANVTIAQFKYLPGDLATGTRNDCVPTITKGHSLTFFNADASNAGIFSPIGNGNPIYVKEIFHTVTTCQNPCGLDTGISYPLANGGGGNFDSGQLGTGTPASGEISWTTPTNLKPGTYTYFCRIHPFMRGVFRIIG
jgi:hypothetical protein